MPVVTDSATARLTAFLLPGGKAAVDGVRGVKTTQRGEIRSGPRARWMPFEAEEFIDATRSEFHWEARMGAGRLFSVHATDKYEDGRGSLVVKKGPIRLIHVEGPDADRGELQRYLSYPACCPPMLLNNPSLEISDVDRNAVRIRDRNGSTDAFVVVHIADEGAPIEMRAIRPMLVGTKSVPTPWSATGSDPAEHDGMRVWRTLEASWHSSAGLFTYIRIESTSFSIVK